MQSVDIRNFKALEWRSAIRRDIACLLGAFYPPFFLKCVLLNTFILADSGRHIGVIGMTTKQMKCCWRADLSEFRGLSYAERSGFLICLEWSRKKPVAHAIH